MAKMSDEACSIARALGVVGERWTLLILREACLGATARSRSAYRLTPAGRELQVVLSALQQWGDERLPRPEGPSMLRRVRGTDCPVHVGYLDDAGREVPFADVAVIPAG